MHCCLGFERDDNTPHLDQQDLIKYLTCSLVKVLLLL